jgi:hypothetical protein
MPRATLNRAKGKIPGAPWFKAAQRDPPPAGTSKKCFPWMAKINLASGKTWRIRFTLDASASVSAKT